MFFSNGNPGEKGSKNNWVLPYFSLIDAPWRPDKETNVCVWTQCEPDGEAIPLITLCVIIYRLFFPLFNDHHSADRGYCARHWSSGVGAWPSRAGRGPFLSAGTGLTSRFTACGEQHIQQSRSKVLNNERHSPGNRGREKRGSRVGTSREKVGK